MISKKDLLKETGISYGQLYRWKRENLIPEEWFVKQSSYTGQETFFPKDKILNRIKAIQELKDRYSLEELSKILSPEMSQRSFAQEDIKLIEEIDVNVVGIFESLTKKSSFSYLEIITIIAFSQIKKEFTIIDKLQLNNMIGGIVKYLDKLKSTEYILLVYNNKNNYYSVLCGSNAEIYMDNSLQLIKAIKIDEISNIMKIKYKNSLSLSLFN